MFIAWYLEPIDSYFIENVNDNFDKFPYELVLLEEMYYNCLYLSKTVFAVPTMVEESSTSLLYKLQEDDCLFSYKFVIYSKLRDTGWIIKDGFDYGCHYALYPGSVQNAHSLFIASIDFNTEYCNKKIEDLKIVKCIVHRQNEKQLKLLEDKSYYHFKIDEIDSIQELNGCDHTGQITWSFIQRMTRLAASQHKVWVCLSLTPEFDQLPHTVEDLSERIQHSTLHINSYEHWQPNQPGQTNLRVLTK